MDLRHLRHFLAVADERQFTRAAQRVNIVQSALSTSIRALESELGVPLFHRSTRTVRLTAAGRALRPHARRILEMEEHARAVVDEVRGIQRGRLTVGIIQSLSPFMDLPGVLGEFHARHRRVEIGLRQDSASSLLEAVRRGEVDVAFLPWFGPSSGVATRGIVRQSLVVACPPGHSLADADHLSLHDLVDEVFVDFQRDWGTRRIVDRAFEDAGISRHIAFEVGDVRTVLDLVARGFGVALVPGLVVGERARASGTLPLRTVPLTRPSIQWELVAAYAETAARGGASSEPTVHAFLDLLPAA